MVYLLEQAVDVLVQARVRGVEAQRRLDPVVFDWDIYYAKAIFRLMSFLLSRGG